MDIFTAFVFAIGTFVLTVGGTIAVMWLGNIMMISPNEIKEGD